MVKVVWMVFSLYLENIIWRVHFFHVKSMAKARPCRCYNTLYIVENISISVTLPGPWKLKSKLIFVSVFLYSIGCCYIKLKN